MASTVGQFITASKFEKLINQNIENPKRMVQVTHLYLTLKEGLIGLNIKMKPINNGVWLSIPHLGKMRVYIFENEEERLFLNEEPIDPTLVLKNSIPPSYFHSNGNVYLFTDLPLATNQIPSSYSVEKMSLIKREYAIASVKSAIEYYRKRKPEKIWALQNSE